MNSNLPAMNMKAESAVLQPRHLHQSMVSCVVPAYNEHDNLGLLLPRLQAVLTQTGADWEVIVVDDGSRDATATLMTAWTQNPGFRYIQLSRNFGKEPAITAGIEASVGDAVLILDADLQHPPELLPKMLSRWQAGIDMIYAVRENRNDESFGKRLGTRLFYSLLKPSRGVVVPPHAGDFRLMDRTVVDALLRLPERNRFMKGLYAWVGFNTEAIQYVPDARLHGDSRFGVLKLLRLALAGLLSFTTWPLRLVSIFGLVVSMCSFGYGIIIVIQYLLYKNPVDGWPTIVTVLLFFSGINLMSLGVVGEYIAGIFDEVKSRPLYIVRQAVGQAFKNPKS
jgi:glycosyltransferase involved in cell wall biosynthesis